jgi:hypothetical protein
MKLLQVTGISLFLFLVSNLDAESVMKQTIYIEEVTHNTMAGREMTTVKKTYYTVETTLIVDSAQPFTILINLKKKRVFFIDDAHKRYSEMSLADFRELTYKNNPLVQLSNKDVVYKETGRKKTIKGYDCFEVTILMQGLGLKTTAWMGKVSHSLDLYYTFSQKSGMGSQLTSIIDLQKKYNAYTIESVTTPISAALPRGSVTVMVKKILLKKYPENFFRVPKTYEKVSLQ